MAGKTPRGARRRPDKGFLLRVLSGKAWPQKRPFFSLYLLLFVIGIAGCAGRKPIVSNAPTAPVSTPPATEEEAKRSTSNEPRPKPAPSTKGNRPADSSSPGIYVEEGNASWYGAPFHGRKASNGETYDMNKMTAAHRTLPFDSMVRVTNLNNGKTATVRITDRGPFVDNRIIDLSFAAAKAIESVGAGVVPVRIEVISGPDPYTGFFTVQVGAFRERGNAERLKERLGATYSPIFIQLVNREEGNFYRVQVGRVPAESDARQLGEELKAKEGFRPLILRMDDKATEESTP